jgi:hypothetical protein
MSLPYETATAGDRALVELQRMLAKFGCSSFATGTDIERGVTVVTFKHRDRVVQLEASWRGYAQALLRNCKRPHDRRVQDRCMEQARISVCSVLRDWTKAQITAVEAGVMSFEAVFMPHMLTRDGRRVVDAAQAANLLPAPNEKVREIGGQS